MGFMFFLELFPQMFYMNHYFNQDATVMIPMYNLESAGKHKQIPKHMLRNQIFPKMFLEKYGIIWWWRGENHDFHLIYTKITSRLMIDLSSKDKILRSLGKMMKYSGLSHKENNL